MLAQQKFQVVRKRPITSLINSREGNAMTDGRSLERPWRCATQLLFLFLVSGAGCSNRDEPDLVVVSDSAGVAVVSNQAGESELASLVTFGPPTLRLGVLEGDAAYTFSSIRAVRGLSDGGVLVAEAQARELRVFDESGRYVRTIGGRGEGPGEFANLSGIVGLAEDTVWVWDSRIQRLTAFLLTGELLGATTGGGDAYGRISQLNRLPDGTFIAQSEWRAREPGFSAPDFTGQ